MTKHLPHPSKSQWLIISLTIFLVGTVFLSGRDYIIHKELYEYNLQWDMSWVMKDWIIYLAELQTVAVASVLIARSHRLNLLIFFEAFIFSSTQDLIYCGLWGGMNFPTGDWTWLLGYSIFGTWTTPIQLLYSGLALSFGALTAYYLPKKIGDYKIP